MRRALTAAALAIAAFAVPAAAAPPARITIVAVFDPITIGERAFINGQLLGDDSQAGQLVTLQESPFPFGAWTDAAQITTDDAGYYSFKREPSLITRFRTVWNGQVVSEREVQVSVAPRVRLKVEAVGRATLRYSGTLAPAHDGQRISIQRQSSRGAWTTIASPRLREGKTFEGRLRARKPTVLRAFFATDGDHLDGYSKPARGVPGAARASAVASGCRAPVITNLAFKPSPPVAGKGATLRVRSSLPDGRLYAIDARWGEGDTRDHFTLAPKLRKPSVVFTLRHRYKKPGRYRLTVRTFGIRDGCKRASRALRPLVRVAGS